MRREWTVREHELAVEAAGDGATAREIGEELGRSESSVYNYLYRNGVRVGGTGTPPDAAKRADLMELLGAGLSVIAVARLRGVCDTTVLRMVRRLEKLGLVRREGTSTRNVRYVPTPKWYTTDDPGWYREEAS